MTTMIKVTPDVMINENIESDEDLLDVCSRVVDLQNFGMPVEQFARLHRLANQKMPQWWRVYSIGRGERAVYNVHAHIRALLAQIARLRQPIAA